MAEDLGKRLGGYIAARRKALGLTQDFVAQRLAVEIETVSRIERGVSVPSLRTLLAIARELSTSVQELLGEASNTTSVSDVDRLIVMLEKLDSQDRTYVIESTQELCRHLLSRR